jgi:uncharacterized membrane protein
MVKQTKSRAPVVSELFRFLWKRKMWWLVPLIFVLLIVGIMLIIATASPALAPFIYTLF